MNLQRDYYEVLGVPYEASTDDIKRKYRELARKFHPDLVADKALGQRIFSQVNQAYRVLVDPEKRTQYDMTIEPKRQNSAAKAAFDAQPKAPPRPAPVSPPPPPPRPAPVAQSQPTPPPRPAPVAQSQPTPAPKPPTDTQKTIKIASMLGEADMAMMQGDAGRARTVALDVLELERRNVKALTLLGDALVQLNKPKEAILAYTSANSLSPSSLLQNKLRSLGHDPTAKTQAAKSPNKSPLAGTGASISDMIDAIPKPADERKAKKKEEPKPGLFGRFLGRK